MAGWQQADSEQDALQARLRRYAPDRYPVQHATTQFHLGSVLLHAGKGDAALQALTVARDMFARAGMALEQAKAAIMLGIALRAAGRSDAAGDAFTDAVRLVGDLDQPAEQGAAAYNLGLVRQDVGDADGAHASWADARRIFLAAGYPAQAAAAARDHGASLLQAGQANEAAPLLEEALTLAERTGDSASVGAAANALGLAELAAGEPAAAVTALRRAVVAFPRSVRPADHAMAKANLALAHEAEGDLPRARLAARQALGVAAAAAPVRAQAQQLLTRVDADPHDDLMVVLDGEDRDNWVRVLREEVARAAESSTAERGDVVRRFLDGLLVRPGASHELAQSLLHVVLELPPRPYDLLVAAIVDGCSRRPAEDAERLRGIVASAMARFAMPQWQRLAASLNAAAQRAGEPATWR